MDAEHAADLTDLASVTQDLLETQAYARSITRYSLLRHANILVHLLIIQKQLPPFYFAQAATEVGIAPQIYRYWRIDNWPIHLHHNDDRLQSIVQVLERVHIRLCRYPTTETYPQAVQNLRDRIDHLKNDGFSHNRIAQHLRFSFRTLADITKPDPEGKHRPRHCPWSLLEKLEDAEERINTQVHSRTATNLMPRGNRAEDEELLPPPPLPEHLIQPHDNCRKCGATWVHLYENGSDVHKTPIFTCRTCGKDNLVNMGPQGGTSTPRGDAPREEFIERYAPCWNCKGPWHNLSRDGEDQWGNVLYTCVLCTYQNRVSGRRRVALRNHS